MPRIAFQGGGARLADLLAAASAIYKSRIGCSAYAGTSAGSIVATLLAAKIDPRRLRDYFLQNRAELEKILPRRSRWSILWLAYRVGVSGKPVIDLENVRQVISKAFDALGLKKESEIRKISPNLFIIAANIRDNQPRVFTDDDNLLDSVVRSCAIPLVFTAASTHDRHIVDGGVFNNLPVDVLLGKQNDPEDVIAFAFKEDLQFDPKNALQYVFDVFSSMIDARVEDSRVRVGPGNVCEIDTKIDSFSVADFFRGLEDPAFSEREKEIAQWLKSWISKDRAQFRDLRAIHRHPIHYSSYLCDKVRALESMFVDAPRPNFETVDITIVPSINQEEDGYDGLIYQAKLRPHEDRLQHTFTCYTMTPGAGQELISADWHVSDDAGNTVPHVAFPLVTLGNPRTKVVLFFGTPLRSKKDGGSAYTVRQRQIIKGFMADLQAKEDWFELTVLKDEAIGRLRISLSTRRGWGEFSQRATAGSPGYELRPSVTEDDDLRNLVVWQADNLKGGDNVYITYARRRQ